MRNEKTRVKMQNTFRVGTVSKTRASEGKMLVDVDVQGAELHDVPVKALANSFVKLFVPVLVGEQVFVFTENGDMEKAYCMPSLFNSDNREPSGGDASTVVLEVGGNTFKIDANTVHCTTETFTIDGDLNVNGSTTIEEDLTVVGDIAVTNVVASGTVTDSDGNNGA